MKSPGQFSFKLPELLILVFELNLGAAGLLMLVAAVRGNPSGIDIPAQALMRIFPALLCVGFAAWLVFRLRCLGQATSRRWGQLGAVCLTFVALGFGTAVGRLGIVTMTTQFRSHLDLLLSDPMTHEAGLTSHLSFLWIGLVFGLTFFLRVGTRRFQTQTSRDALHMQLNEIGQHVLGNWSEQLVARIDSLVADGRRHDAIQLYQHETKCSLNEASITIADWEDHRLRLQIDVLRETLTTENGRSPITTAATST
ncbi:MAG: hypothetical protein ACYTGL_26935 [Planctomycetota bacterium]|jgi:hypothetical protein